MDDNEVFILSPYEMVIPGVDAAMALQLRKRAEECLKQCEADGDYVENHPALVMAICMDDAYAFTVEARLS